MPGFWAWATKALLLVAGWRTCCATRSTIVSNHGLEGGDLCKKWLILKYDNDNPQTPFVGSVNYEQWDMVELFKRRTLNGCMETFKASCTDMEVHVKRNCSGKIERWNECLGGFGCRKWRHYDAGAELWLRGLSGEWSDVILSSGRVTLWAEHPHVAQLMELVKQLRDPVKEEVAEVADFANDINGGGYLGTSVAHRIKMLPRNAVEELRSTARRLRYARNRERRIFGHIMDMNLVRSQRGLPAPKAVIGKLAGIAHRYNLLKQMDEQSLETMSEYLKDPEGEPDQMVFYMRGLRKHQSLPKAAQPRVLIFTCSYGGGHASAAKAVTGYLQQGGFAVQVVDTTRDRQFRSHSEVIGDYMFNEVVLKRQWYEYHNFIDKLKSLFQGQLVQPCPAPWCNTQRKDLFRSAILESSPDLIVTVYHMDLLPMLEVAVDLGNLPLLHLATDIDIKMHEVFSRNGPVPSYPRFMVGVPFDISATWDTIAPLDKSKTFVSGYPVRDAFLKPAPDAETLAAQRAEIAPAGTLLVLVMTGGGGQDVPWPELLANSGSGQGVPVHVMVVAGGNNKMAQRLSVALPGRQELVPGRTVWSGSAEDVTVEVVTDPANTNEEKPYFLGADRLSFLMDVSDALITKPGGGTTAEAAYRGVPAVFDATAGLLHWEDFTVKAFENHKRGIRMTAEKDLKSTLKKAIGYGRSSKLAQASEGGAIIDTGVEVREAARRLLMTPCKPPCVLFDDS